MEHDLYRLKTELNEQGIFFCLSGPVSQKLVTDIGVILDQKMGMENASKLTVLRVFSLVVEKVQNIIHYSDEKALAEDSEDAARETLRFGIIAIGYHEEHYFVLSGNMIRNDKVERLREKLCAIQNMSKEELKHAYREQRRKPPENDSKGAGLGFFEMAKKASRPIEFTFKRLSDEMSFFSIKTTI